MDLAVVFAVFPIIFIGELPDKTMFTSLVLASRGRPAAVWLGSTLAFTVHVAIAVSVGVALFKLLPSQAVEILAGVLFLAGAVYSWLTRNAKDEERVESEPRSALATIGTAAALVFVAEWGDLTQILTANLAATYHSALSVAVGSEAALLVAAAIAVVLGQRLSKLIKVRMIRIVTAIALLGLAGWQFAVAAL